MPSSSSNTLQQEEAQEAQKIIHRFMLKTMKKNKTHDLVTAFRALGLTIHQIKNPDNNITLQQQEKDLFALLRRQETISTFKACFQRIHILCDLRHKPKLENRKDVIIRHILASYPLICFPSNDPTLFFAALRLLHQFEEICNACLAHVFFADIPHHLTADFSDLLVDYLEAFANRRHH